MPNNAKLGDGLLAPSHALPAAPGTVYTPGIDTGGPRTSNAAFLPACFTKIAAPALNTTQLPDGEAAVYSIQHDSDPAFGTATTLYTVGTQTGAGGVGAAAASFDGRVPPDVKQYIRGACTTSGGAGDCSAATFSLSLLF